MNTNAHEWQKKDLTTKKSTKGTKIRRGGRKNHEYTRMHTNEYELSNHEKHEKHENNGIIQNHECTRMAKEGFNHEKHERHENNGIIQNHE